MSKQYDYDLIVIGAGSGGLTAAKEAVKLGKKVAIAEKDEIGGTCVNRGCVPTKLMLYAANVVNQQELAKDYGWVNPQGLFDWNAFKGAMEKYLHSLRKTQREKLDQIDILTGSAVFVDSHTIDLNGSSITSSHFLLAVGSRPTLPDIEGIEHALSSRDIFKLESLPQSIVIAGGGYIGVEFSQILRNLGCNVTLVESSSLPLSGFDCDIQELTRKILVDDQIDFRGNVRLSKIVKKNDESGYVAILDNGESIQAGQVLCSLGRTPNTDGLNLSAVQLESKKAKINVDEWGQTQQPHIYAVGDCIDKMMLTPVAKAQAAVCVQAMFGDRPVPIDYRWVPSAVFIDPEIAMVGLTEEEASKTYSRIDVTQESFSPLRYAFSSSSPDSVIKVISESSSNRIVGFHCVAPRAADLVQPLVPALRKGLTKDELMNTIGIHPTLGEEIFSL